MEQRSTNYQSKKQSCPKVLPIWWQTRDSLHCSLLKDSIPWQDSHELLWKQDAVLSDSLNSWQNVLARQVWSPKFLSVESCTTPLTRRTLRASVMKGHHGLPMSLFLWPVSPFSFPRLRDSGWWGSEFRFCMNDKLANLGNKHLATHKRLRYGNRNTNGPCQCKWTCWILGLGWKLCLYNSSFTFPKHSDTFLLCSPGSQFRSDNWLLLGPLTAMRVWRKMLNAWVGWWCRW